MVLFISVDGACDGHLIGSAEVTAHAGSAVAGNVSPLC
jgi:hypothetical protein